MKTDNKFEPYHLKIKAAFNKSAGTYDNNAVLQQEVGTRLCERLEFFALKPDKILDIGMGTGFVTKHLRRYYPDADIIGIDLAYNMLQFAGTNNLTQIQNFNLICADMSFLPIADKSIDLVFSNFSMHWGESLTRILQECFRVLKPNGLIIFSLPGPNTLIELKEALNIIDPEYDHVNNFIDMHDIGDILVQTKFAHPVMDNEYFTLTYNKVTSILKDLKAVGANVKLSNNYRKSLWGKNKIKQLMSVYDRFKQDDKYPLTYEIIYGHAFKLKKPVKAKYPEISEVSIPIEKIIIK